MLIKLKIFSPSSHPTICLSNRSPRLQYASKSLFPNSSVQKVSKHKVLFLQLKRISSIYMPKRSNLVGLLWKFIAMPILKSINTLEICQFFLSLLHLFSLYSLSLSVLDPHVTHSSIRTLSICLSWMHKYYTSASFFLFHAQVGFVSRHYYIQWG